MQRDWETISRVRLSCIIGVFTLCFVFLTPSAGPHAGWAFFQAARDSTWQRLFEWGSAWCSLKIILSCLGLFMILDCLGTVLTRARWIWLAHLAFYLVIVPCLGFLVGGYYLIKALL